MSRDGRKRAELRCMRSPEARGIGASSAASSRRVGLAGDVMALLPKAEAETTQSALTQKGTALEQKVDESQMALQAKSDEAATAKAEPGGLSLEWTLPANAARGAHEC